MKEGRASRTAEYMALFRALETARPDAERLFEDTFAAAFLSPRLKAVVRASRLDAVGKLARAYIDRRWPGVRTSAVARTCFIDDALQKVLEEGILQVVILGAGFDARAYRLAALERVDVFEVDHPSTSAAKRGVIHAALGSLPRHVRFVPVDFGTESWTKALVSTAGYDAARPTAFVWEGVTNYLSSEAVHRTLRWCATSAPGSALIFTYMDKLVLDSPEVFAGTERLFATLRAEGEEWKFGEDPAVMAALLGDLGFSVEEDVAANDYRARYYGEAARSMRGYEFYRIAVCRSGDSPDTQRAAGL